MQLVPDVSPEVTEACLAPQCHPGEGERAKSGLDPASAQGYGFRHDSRTQPLSVE
jgi:hypothetical protein